MEVFTMVKPITKDVFLLMKECEPATPEDVKTVAKDLMDTFLDHGKLTGMAANMIGYTKRIIVVNDNGTAKLMLNPEIVSCSGLYPAEEYCICLDSRHTAKRYQTIEVKYQDASFTEHCETYTDFIARIIQHQVDHCNGLLI